jgi:hypothetical protein
MRLLAFLLLIPGLAFAQELHTFENGQVADADEINENFQSLAQQTAALGIRITALEESSVEPPPDNVFRISLETPLSGTTLSGVKTISGWAIANSGIDRIEIYIDDVYNFDIAHGTTRGDVGSAFPDIDNSDKSGFATRFNYNNLVSGEHTLTAKAISNGNNVLSSSATFSVTKFNKPFISPQDVFSLDNASCSIQSNNVAVFNALVDGSFYDISIQWSTAAQDFEIVDITSN